MILCTNVYNLVRSPKKLHGCDVRDIPGHHTHDPAAAIPHLLLAPQRPALVEEATEVVRTQNTLFGQRRT